MSPAENAVEIAMNILGDRARRDVPIGPLTTYRVGGAAAVFAEANALDDLEVVAAAANESGLEVLTLGRGSNMLVSDSGFLGIALCLGDGFTKIHISDDHVVRAGSATALPVLARRTVQESLAGMEWAVGVPGSVGGAVRMNAGGHGSDVAESLLDIVVFDLDAGRADTRTKDDLALRFRGSAIGPHDIVCEARFALRPGDRATGEATLREIVRWRRENQPGGQNAGSVFVNPFDGADSAGRLIDEVGLKGFRMGSAHVSEKHANFVQADEGGSADDVRDLMATIIRRVHEAHGIELRSEIRLIGFAEQTFGDGTPAGHDGTTP